LDRSKGRDDTDRHSDERRHERGKDHDGVVERNLVRAREVCRQRGRDEAHDIGRREEAAGAAHDAQEQALDQQLPNQPPPACAKCGPDAQLPLAARVANELQAHEVGNADEQHACHCAEEHPENALAVPHDVVEEQRGGNRTIGAGVRIRKRRPGGDLRVGRADGSTRLQPRQHPELWIGRRPLADANRVPHNRKRVPVARHICAGCGDPDDSHRSAPPELEALPKHIQCASKSRPPQVVTNDRYIRIGIYRIV
jgi:hypothetical protein